MTRIRIYLLQTNETGIVKFINENKELEIGYIKDAIEKIYDTKKDVLLQIIDEYRGTQNKHAEKRIDDLEKAMSDNIVSTKNIIRWLNLNYIKYRKVVSKS